MNPKSKVPTLRRDDGTVLTEYPAIAVWLASTFPEAKLLPKDADKLAKALEYTDFAVATLHMQGFSRIFRPSNYAPTESDHEAVKAKGEEIFAKGLGIFDKALEGKEYLLGDSPSPTARCSTSPSGGRAGWASRCRRTSPRIMPG
ncbi:glutathione S-transferase family protein [Dankookia sp. P2]|uniref:glutathione S-transferase family protein n=1 Tax=Dankookia sp. P2 TaxID=3423955 RepID=UPI003D674D3E